MTQQPSTSVQETALQKSACKQENDMLSNVNLYLLLEGKKGLTNNENFTPSN